MPRKPSVEVEATDIAEEPRVKRAYNKKAKIPEPKKTAKAKEKDKGSKLSKIADAFAGFQHARETLTEVSAVPTIFVQLDHATGVGGWPTKRFTMVHGPSGRGKTKFVIGLMLSFLMKKHYVYYVDAERTTPFKFVKTMMGKWADSEGFFAVRPDSYEDVVGSVRAFCNGMIAKRKAGEISEDTTGLIVVDSMRKLVPKDMFAEILKAVKEDSGEESEGKSRGKKGGITTGKDRRAQIQAKMNAAWMDEVIPLLEKANVGMVAIAREMEDPDAHQATKKAGWGFKIGGGGAIFYDASLVVRVDRQSYVEEGGGEKKEEDGEFVKKKVYGEKHKVTIHKTKISGHEDKKTVAFFHASNGAIVPEGFDRARDLVEMSVRFDVGVEKNGSWFSFNGERLGQGLDNAVVSLSKQPETLDLIEKELRGIFEEKSAPELIEGRDFDGVTGEVFS